MATYEYVCLACDRPFEHDRPMGARVLGEPVCPSCGSESVRRRFSFLAGRTTGGDAAISTSGCGCGGACACRG